MGTSTKEISERLRKQALEKLKPFIAELVEQGISQDKIIAVVKKHVNAKISSYYRGLKEPSLLGAGIKPLLAQINGHGRKADSKAECMFYEMLCNEGFDFRFQYPVGHYRVDYLIGETLIVELDGPQHQKTRDEIRDKYLTKMGYRILRVSLPTVALDPGAVMREIKNLV